MKFHHIVKPFLIMLLLGLAVGCASTPDEPAVADQATAEQAISDAKAANAQAKGMGAEWRDTGKIIKEAEAALAAGDYTKATDLANKAKRQAENAMAQARAEADRLKAEGAISGSAAMGSGADSYTVVSGDNLWSISGKDDIYANPYQWPLIYKANRDKINDADLIFAGQTLDIDRSASSSDIDAAIQHAKTRGAWSIGVT
ncbi:MAG: LysM peptidoglycan-binding domain-containing protein, partial [Gammaproteobacteria bacterium]|nr:LysM peptidoglycan-binding domain-containing protein [Gammaproteobacteria bacterium]